MAAERSAAYEAPAAEVTRRTLVLELWRSVPLGILETAWGTFAVLLLVKVFAAEDSAKQFLLGFSRLGLIASLAIPALLHGVRVGDTRLAAAMNVAGGLGFAAAAAFPGSLPVFVVGVGVGLFAFTLQVPLMTRIYRRTWPDSRRGRLFSITGIARSVVAIAASLAGGVLLERRIDLYPWLLAGFALACFASAFLLTRLPADEEEVGGEDGGRRDVPFDRPRGPGIFGALRWVRRDPVFALLLASWMAMGLGNLMAMALYVDFLAHPGRGLGLGPSKVALLTGVVPVGCRLLTGYAWGALFDRLDFFRLRLLLNAFCAAAVLLVFLGRSVHLVALGMMAHGIALGGGNVAWNLWVTKIAPAERVGEYMAVHTFTTGIRGVAAPVAAFALIAAVGPAGVAVVCAACIAVGSALLAPRAIAGGSGRASSGGAGSGETVVAAAGGLTGGASRGDGGSEPCGARDAVREGSPEARADRTASRGTRRRR